MMTQERIAEWFSRCLGKLQSNANVLMALFTLIQTAVLGFGLYYASVTLGYAAMTLAEGNRISWRTYLDTHSSEMVKNLLEQDAMRCIYQYDIAIVDNECPAKVYDKKNLTQVIVYAGMAITTFKEAKLYARMHQHRYFEEWYARDADNFSKDPTGVISFVLYDMYQCGFKEHCADKIKYDTSICIADENFRIDERNEQHCLKNLLAHRKKFLESVGDRGK
jgi:hypothetical protein